MMMSRYTLLLMSLLCNGTHAGVIAIYPDLQDPKLIEIAGDTQCVDRDIALERVNDTLTVYAGHVPGCGFDIGPLRRIRIDQSCISVNGCAGPVNRVEVRVSNEPGCKPGAQPAAIPECLRGASIIPLTARNPVLYRSLSLSTVYRGTRPEDSGAVSVFVVTETRDNGNARVTVDHVNEARGFALTGPDGTFSVLQARDGGEYYVMHLSPTSIAIITPQNHYYGAIQESPNGAPIYRFDLRKATETSFVVDPRRLPGRFKLVNSALGVNEFSLKECIESLGSGGSIVSIACPIVGDGSYGGQLFCMAGVAGEPNSCELVIHGKRGLINIRMADEQFGYDAWYGLPKMDPSVTCCVHVRDAFAVRLR